MKIAALAAIWFLFAMVGESAGKAPPPLHTPTLAERAAACAGFPTWVQRRIGERFPDNTALAARVTQEQRLMQRVEVYVGEEGCYAEPIRNAVVGMPQETALSRLRAVAVRDYRHLKDGATPVYVVFRIAKPDGLPVHGGTATVVFYTISMNFKIGDGPTTIA